MNNNKKLFFTIVLITSLFTGKTGFASTSSFAFVSGLPQPYLLTGIHGEYGTVIEPNTDQQIEEPGAAGIDFLLLISIEDKYALGLYGDISYEISRECYRGRYGVEFYLENDMLVQYPHTKFSIALRGGGIKRFGNKGDKGVFYGVGIIFPTPHYLYSSNIIYSIYIDGNHYLENGKTQFIDVVGTLGVSYKFWWM